MFVIKNSILSLIGILFSLMSFAQPNALVMGKIENVDYVKEIDLRVNLRYIDGNFVTYTSKVLEDGSFAFAVEMIQPQLVTLSYAQNAGVFYLEPNDTVYIDTNANNFQYSFEFSGRGGANNRFLADYFKENPIDATPFSQVQYKKGVYWYSINEEIDRLMQNSKPEIFKKNLQLRKESAFLELDNYQSLDESSLTAEFKDFMAADILYNYAYHMLAYGSVYKNVHGIDSDFLDFTYEIPLQSSQIGSHWYREYLLAYLNYKILQKEEVTYSKVHDAATNKLGSVALAFVQSEMISKGLLKNVNETLPLYLDFVENNPYLEFDEKVLTAYQKARRTSIGTNAPDFSMTADDGKLISLSDYKGKVIYLNFWASWCRPCMNKMTEMKQAQTELEEQGIVVLNVSFDRQKDTWQQTITDREFGGIHLFAEGNIDSDIATLYDIDAIPQYFIINRRGQFANKPLKYSISEIKTALEELAQ